MKQRTSFKTFLRDNGLFLVLMGLFAAFLAGLAATGHAQHNDELLTHQQAALSFWHYITSGPFVEAVFENWESEFLQMGALVVLTMFLRQKGSADSKKLRGKEPEDAAPRYSLREARTWRQRQRAIGAVLYGNSLSLALFGLFILSFLLHAWGGTASYNTEAAAHGEPSVSVFSYIASNQFWFESFQNWQSEFLAVAALIILSVFLRQRHSPESKPVGDTNKKTGG